MEGPELKALPLSGHSPSTLIASPVRPSLPKVEGEVSMTMEVRELPSLVWLDTSEHASWSSTPKRQEPVVLVTPLLSKPEDFPKPVDTSSQVSTPDNAEMEDLRGNPFSFLPYSWSPMAQQWCPPTDATHLWEEANKALGDQLMVKSSIDACPWKLVLEFSMALHENDSETTESIKEAKAICTHSIQEVENCCSVAIREAEAWKPPRWSPFSSHTIKPFSTLKRSLLKRRERVNSTSSPSARLPCGPSLQNSMTC